MADITDDISLVNAALALFGGGAILQFEEETDLADVCARLYTPTIDAILAKDFLHLRQTKKLEKMAVTPENGFGSAFAFPAGAITEPRRLTTNPRSRSDNLRDFTVEGRTIYADADNLWGIFGMRLAPELWSIQLRQAAIVALAAVLVVPVCEDKDLAAQYDAQAWGTPQQQRMGGLVGMAITADHAQAPARQPLGDGFPTASGSVWL